MALRESKRHRDKRPFMPFGDMMLPVIGFVAVGLLVAGIKLFFLSGPKPRAYEAVAVAEQKINVLLAPTKTVQNEKAEKAPSVSLPASLISLTPAAEKKDLILAVPAAVSAKRESDSAVREANSKKESLSRKKESKVSSNKINISKNNLPVVKNKVVESKAKQKISSNIIPNTIEKSSLRWGIQVGSFTEKNVANSVMAKLQKKKYNVTIISAVVREKKYYRVIVIEGTDRNKAENRAQLLTREGYPVLVVPVK